MQKHGDKLLAVAVAGSCLPISIVKDSNVKNWVKFIAPQVIFCEFIVLFLNKVSLV